MGRCLSLNFRRTSSCRSSSSEEVEEGDGTPAVIREVRKEMEQAVGSKSFNEIRDRMESRDVLIPLDITVKEKKKAGALTRMVWEYYEHTNTTATLCLDLHKALRTARSVNLNLNHQLQHQHQHQHTTRALVEFQSIPNPFSHSHSHSVTSLSSAFHLLETHCSGLRSGSVMLWCFSPALATLWRLRRTHLDTLINATLVRHRLDTIHNLVSCLQFIIDDNKDYVRTALDLGLDAHLIQEILNKLRNTTLQDRLLSLDNEICLLIRDLNHHRSCLHSQLTQYRHCML